MAAPDGADTTWASSNTSWASTTISWTGGLVPQHSYAEGFTGDEGPPDTWRQIVRFAEDGARRGSDIYYY